MNAAVPSVLLVGCGDIALRLSRLLAGRFVLTGLRRQPLTLPKTIAPLAVDVTNGESVAAALRGRRFDYAVITLTPGALNEQRYRAVYVDGTARILAALQPNTRVLFVSSTSVYGDSVGEWVDEQTPAQTSAFSGRVLREAEQRVAESGLPFTCIRCSGIYGPGRVRLLQQVRSGAVDVAKASQFTNRIHADDVARVLEFLMTRWEQGVPPDHCYVASDTCPVLAGVVWRELATQMGVPLILPAGWEQRASTGKRCSSARLQQQGFRWQYPDFAAGYAALLAAE